MMTKKRVKILKLFLLILKMCSQRNSTDYNKPHILCYFNLSYLVIIFEWGNGHYHLKEEK